jgi:septum formation protein
MIVEAPVTEVTFAPLSDSEIERYLDTGEWNGVAGGYRIQGHAGAFVTHLSGSYTSVMGLPLGTVYSIIK